MRKIFRTTVLGSFLLVLGLGVGGQARAQDAKAQYPSMAPLDQYLITDRDAEIALARSAAPESLSRDAEVLVLGRHGLPSKMDRDHAAANEDLVEIKESEKS